MRPCAVISPNCCARASALRMTRSPMSSICWITAAASIRCGAQRLIELKSDLRRELSDVQARMPDYLADAARRTSSPRPVTGIATDGATFIGYQLVEGALKRQDENEFASLRHCVYAHLRKPT